MELRLDNDVAIVTASSSGLGKASAKALASEGADVIINGRNAEKLEQTRDEIESHALGEVLAVQGDITEQETAESLVGAAVDEFGRLDHLVTSAGGPPTGKFLETTNEQWYDAFDMLVMSVVRLVREAADPLRADGGGSMVNITSTLVKEPLEALILSNSIRMSVIGLAKTLSNEFAPDVRVNAVLPGGYETPRVEEIIEKRVERGEYDSYEESAAHLGGDISLNRLGDPDELGGAVAFLCSEQASYLTGSMIPVDGGRLKSHL